MTEQDMLVEMAKRLESAGKVFAVEYPTETVRRLEYESGPYAVRFIFDDNGTVVESVSVI